MTAPTLATENRLARQRKWAAAATNHHGAGRHIREHEELLDAWGDLNGIKRSTSPFSLSCLRRGGPRDLAGDRWGRGRGWPGADHMSYFKRELHGAAAAVVAEPYVTADVEQLAEFLRGSGLMMHQPPNPKASFWCPGASHFVVIVREDFGEVKWLADQLEFTHCD